MVRFVESELEIRCLLQELVIEHRVAQVTLSRVQNVEEFNSTVAAPRAPRRVDELHRRASEWRGDAF